MSVAEHRAAASGAEIRAATPLLLLATKFCARKGRGRGDLLASLDVHDVLTLIDALPELAEEVRAAPPKLRDHIRAELAALQAESYFDYAVEGAMAGYGPVGADRASLVTGRIDELLASRGDRRGPCGLRDC